MSEYIGVLNRDGQPVTPSVLQSMLNTEKPVPSEAGDIWTHKAIGSGFRRNQSASSPNGFLYPESFPDLKLVLTGDLRLDNREELRQKLHIRVRNHQITDAAIVAEAYRKWGRSCPAYLLGAFSFILWDQKKEQLFGARDHAGIRPFYYHYAPARFVCASNMASLLNHPSIPSDINQTHVGFFLAHLPAPFRRVKETFFSSINRLLPGHSIRVSRTRLETRRYREPEPSSYNFSSSRQWESAFRHRFRQAVNRRLQHGSPIHSTLSGGLDSSSVTCMADTLLQECGRNTSLKSIHVDFEQESTNETPYVQSVQQHQKLNLQTVRPDSSLQIFREINQYTPRPIWSPNTEIAWSVAKSYQNHPISILLTGQGGDTVVSNGLYYLIELLQHKQFTEFHQALNEYTQKRTSGAFEYDAKAWKSRLIDGLISQYLQQEIRHGNWGNWFHTTTNILRHVPLQIPSRIRLLLLPLLPCYRAVRYHRSTRRNPVVRTDFLQRINMKEHIRKTYRYQQSFRQSSTQHHISAVKSGGLLTMIEQHHHLYALNGIEARHPFLDRELIECCLQAPARLSFDHGRGKGLLRRGLQSILPRKVQQRTRPVGFSGHRIRSLHGPDREQMKELLFRTDTGIEQFIDLDRLREKFNRFQQRAPDGKNVRGSSRILYKTAVLALWLKRWT